MSCRRIFAVAAALVSLGGCQTLSSPQRNIGMEDPALGEAVRYNAAIQTINPDPVYAEDATHPGASGAKGAAAVKRYRTDAVKDVRVMSTTGGSESGSGGPN